MAETIDVIVHGRTCPEWTEPRTLEDWKALELVRIDIDATDTGIDYVWRCPACGANTIFVMDGGTLDFGTEPPLDLDNEDDRAFIESFSAVAKPPAGIGRDLEVILRYEEENPP